jgi:hypothetical protein
MDATNLYIEMRKAGSLHERATAAE